MTRRAPGITPRGRARAGRAHSPLASAASPSAAAVAAVWRGEGRDAAAFAESSDIVDWVVEGRQDGDVVLVMSNGAFGSIWERLLAALEAV